MITRTCRIDPTLLDGPVMDRDGVTYLRLTVRPQKAPQQIRIFEYGLTDLTGKRKRERVAVGLFYDANIVLAASFFLRLSLEYKDVENAKLEIVYEAATRRAKISFSVAKGSLDVVSDVRGPEVGRSPEYEEFLEAPPEEQREIAVRPDGSLVLPAASEVK